MIYIPIDLYEIYYYDFDGNLVLPLTKWNRAEFTQRVNNPWNSVFELVLSKSDPLGPLLRALKRDYILHIYRTDSFTGERTRVYEGLHNTVYEQVRTDGNIFFGLYSSGYTRFLERRSVVPPTGAENVHKVGKAETLIKAFVYENLVNPQTVTFTLGAGTTAKTFIVPSELRKLNGLVIAEDLAQGSDTEYTARFTLLDSVVSTLAENGELFFGIYSRDRIGQFIFDCRPVWGTDRRVDNTAGINPVVFSLELGNMILPILSTNTRYEKNFLYIGGEGEGTNRQIAIMQDFSSITESPWGLSELFVDARGANTSAGLLAIGSKTLKERGKLRTLEFEITNDLPIQRWPGTWGLGDLVTAYYMDERFDKRINEIHINVNSSSVSQTQEQISVELEDV